MLSRSTHCTLLSKIVAPIVPVITNAGILEDVEQEDDPNQALVAQMVSEHHLAASSCLVAWWLVCSYLFYLLIECNYSI